MLRSGKDKDDNLSSLTSSGGIVSIRLESMIDVDIEFRGFICWENRSIDLPKSCQVNYRFNQGRWLAYDLNRNSDVIGSSGVGGLEVNGKSFEDSHVTKS
jgi:hypothetical protein